MIISKWSGQFHKKREEKQTKRKWFAKCYLDTRIKHEDDETHYHISIYDKMDDVNCQIVSFPIWTATSQAIRPMEYTHLSW